MAERIGPSARRATPGIGAILYCWGLKYPDLYRTPFRWTSCGRDYVRHAYRTDAWQPVDVNHPGGNPGANLKSIFHRYHPILVAFVWELNTETFNLPLGCLQEGLPQGWLRWSQAWSAPQVYNYANSPAREKRTAPPAYRGTSLIRKTYPPRTTIGPYA